MAVRYFKFFIILYIFATCAAEEYPDSPDYENQFGADGNDDGNEDDKYDEDYEDDLDENSEYDDSLGDEDNDSFDDHNENTFAGDDACSMKLGSIELTGDHHTDVGEKVRVLRDECGVADPLLYLCNQHATNLIAQKNIIPRIDFRRKRLKIKRLCGKKFAQHGKPRYQKITVTTGDDKVRSQKPVALFKVSASKQHLVVEQLAQMTGISKDRLWRVINSTDKFPLSSNPQGLPPDQAEISSKLYKIFKEYHNNCVKDRSHCEKKAASKPKSDATSSDIIYFIVQPQAFTVSPTPPAMPEPIFAMPYNFGTDEIGMFFKRSGKQLVEDKLPTSPNDHTGTKRGNAFRKVKDMVKRLEKENRLHSERGMRHHSGGNGREKKAVISVNLGPPIEEHNSSESSNPKHDVRTPKNMSAMYNVRNVPSTGQPGSHKQNVEEAVRSTVQQANHSNNPNTSNQRFLNTNSTPTVPAGESRYAMKATSPSSNVSAINNVSNIPPSGKPEEHKVNIEGSFPPILQPTMNSTKHNISYERFNKQKSKLAPHVLNSTPHAVNVSGTTKGSVVSESFSATERPRYNSEVLNSELELSNTSRVNTTTNTDGAVNSGKDNVMEKLCADFKALAKKFNAMARIAGSAETVDPNGFPACRALELEKSYKFIRNNFAKTVQATHNMLPPIPVLPFSPGLVNPLPYFPHPFSPVPVLPFSPSLINAHQPYDNMAQSTFLSPAAYMHDLVGPAFFKRIYPLYHPTFPSRPWMPLSAYYQSNAMIPWHLTHPYIPHYNNYLLNNPQYTHTLDPYSALSFYRPHADYIDNHNPQYMPYSYPYPMMQSMQYYQPYMSPWNPWPYRNAMINCLIHSYSPQLSNNLYYSRFMPWMPSPMCAPLYFDTGFQTKQIQFPWRTPSMSEMNTDDQDGKYRSSEDAPEGGDDDDVKVVFHPRGRKKHGPLQINIDTKEADTSKHMNAKNSQRTSTKTTNERKRDANNKNAHETSKRSDNMPSSTTKQEIKIDKKRKKDANNKATHEASERAENIPSSSAKEQRVLEDKNKRTKQAIDPSHSRPMAATGMYPGSVIEREKKSSPRSNEGPRTVQGGKSVEGKDTDKSGNPAVTMGRKRDIPNMRSNGEEQTHITIKSKHSPYKTTSIHKREEFKGINQNPHEISKTTADKRSVLSSSTKNRNIPKYTNENLQKAGAMTKFAGATGKHPVYIRSSGASGVHPGARIKREKKLSDAKTLAFSKKSFRTAERKEPSESNAKHGNLDGTVTKYNRNRRAATGEMYDVPNSNSNGVDNTDETENSNVEVIMHSRTNRNNRPILVNVDTVKNTE